MKKQVFALALVALLILVPIPIFAACAADIVKADNLLEDTTIDAAAADTVVYTGYIEIVPPKYDEVENFSEGLAAVELDGKWGFIDQTGKEVVPLRYDDVEYFFEGLAAVRVGDWETGKWGFIDKTGKEVVPPKYGRVRDFHEGMAEVKLDGKYGIIDQTGNEVVPPKYDYVEYFHEGFAAVEFDGKWGFIALTESFANPLDSASDWAVEGIVSAIAKGFVPAELQGDYKNVITRAEFCRMAVKFVEYRTGKAIDDVLTEQGLVRDANTFSDTVDPDILAAFALGITSGTGNNKFTPNGQFTREQAATMLRNTCQVLGMDTKDCPPAGFVDMGSVSGWAAEGIDFCRANGIMDGVGENKFGPKGVYTREQSILTFERAAVQQHAQTSDE